jgi:hypothetical protein
VSGLKAIGMVFGGLWLFLMMIIGAGNAYYKKRAQQHHVPRDIPEASYDDYRRGYRASADDDYDREYRRAREGVHIDSGSAKPMVDVDPSHRY